MNTEICSVLLGLMLLVGSARSYAATPGADASTDRTLSPYFFVHSEDPEHDRLPLKDTDVDVHIAGVIAQVRVTQHYRNEGRHALEAEYVFPGSTRAAVYGLSMTIGERRVVAKIREKQKARAEYRAAKAQGRSAALLEQHRPNLFQMHVANILPGDDIKVELVYTEMLVPTDSVYQFVFPTVVGPRYAKGSVADSETEPGTHWQHSPYLQVGEAPTSAFHLKALLNTGIAIQEIGSPSHRVGIRYLNNHRAEIALADGANGTDQANNRDFILNYRLAGNAVESGLLLYQGGDENFFVAMVQPPARPKPAQIPPRDYLFVVDVSGSMYGFPLDTAKVLLHDLVQHLRPTDSFNVMLFAGGNALLAEHSLPATADNIDKALAFIDRQRGGGGTELLPALKRAFAMPADADRARSIVVVTDGYVDVETETFELIRKNLNRANLFAFGIGSAVNRLLIEGMARVGQGEPFVVTQPREAAARADAFRKYIQAPVLTHVQLDVKGLDAYDIEPAAIPDVLASRPVVVQGKWRGERRGTLSITGLTGEGAFKQSFDLATVQSSDDNAALRYLWARSRIARLADYQRVDNSPDRVNEITQLGLKYNLLTAYTSFIAVDQRVRNANPADANTVKQPLPMPAGVSNLAVGGQVPTTPEPETWLLLSVAAGAAAWARRRQAKGSVSRKDRHAC